MDQDGLRSIGSGACSATRPLFSQRVPEISGNVGLERRVIFRDSLRFAGPGNNRGRSRVRQRELQRRCLDRYLVVCAEVGNLLHLRCDRGRHRSVFEVMAACEHAGAIRAANHDIDFLALRGGHQTLEGQLMIEKRIAAGERGGIRVCLGETEQKLHRFDLIHAEAPAFD